jgi:hypothetical protein
MGLLVIFPVDSGLIKLYSVTTNIESLPQVFCSCFALVEFLEHFLKDIERANLL